MKKINRSKDTIEHSWMKLESVFDVKSLKNSKPLGSHRKQESLYSQKPRNKSGRSNNDSPELVMRASTPSTYLHKTTQNIKGITQAQLKLLYHGKCEDLKIPILPDQQFRFFSFCFKHFDKRKFEMQDSGLGFISSTIIGEILAENSYFAFIYLGKNMLNDSGCMNLVKSIQKNASIVHLDLSSNNLSPEGTEQILKILAGHVSLVSLNISSHEGLHRNRLYVPGANGINMILLKSDIVSHLNLAGTSLKEGARGLATGVAKSKSLLSLNLSSNYIQSDCIKVIIDSMTKSQLEIINLADNNLGPEGAEAISNYLARNPPLTILDLSYTSLTGKGFHCLFSSLPNNSHLKNINLSGNPINKYLSQEVIYTLSANWTIEKLDLSSCALRSAGLLVLAEGIARNRSIKLLKLHDNSIGDSGIEGLSLALTTNQSIKFLDLSKNKIKDSGAAYLSKSFRHNCTLEELNLRENCIKDIGGLSINDAVLQTPSLTYICLEFNQVSCKVLGHIQEKLRGNQTQQKKNYKKTLQKQLCTLPYDENAIKKIFEKINFKKREKEDLKNRNDKNVEKMEDIKNSENEKLLILQEMLKGLKEKNHLLSEELEIVRKTNMTCKAHYEKEIQHWTDKHSLIDADIERLIKKSKD